MSSLFLITFLSSITLTYHTICDPLPEILNSIALQVRLNKQINNMKTDQYYSFLALGDSYTYGESVDPGLRFCIQLTNSLKKLHYKICPPKMIARTSWTTGDLLQAIHADGDQKTYDFVFLLIGVNNQYQKRTLQEYENEFTELLFKTIGFAGNQKDHVYVLSIPDYGYTPFGKNNQQEISKEIDLFNDVNKKISIAAAVNYVNITEFTRQGLQDPSLVANDGLHPSGKMYEWWAKKIAPSILSKIRK